MSQYFMAMLDQAFEKSTRLYQERSLAPCRLWQEAGAGED